MVAARERRRTTYLDALGLTVGGTVACVPLGGVMPRAGFLGVSGHHPYDWRIMEPSPSPASGWHVPGDYGGHAAAMQTMASVAAPLLAGFGLTLITLIVQSPRSFQFPDLTLLLLAVVTVGFLASVVFHLHARQRYRTPEEARAAWGDELKQQEERAQRELQDDYKEFLQWACWSRYSFDVSTLLLLAALALVLVPTQPATPARWMAVAAPTLACVLDGLWFIRNLLRRK